jgi:hypothetical protein
MTTKNMTSRLFSLAAVGRVVLGRLSRRRPIHSAGFAAARCAVLLAPPVPLSLRSPALQRRRHLADVVIGVTRGLRPLISETNVSPGPARIRVAVALIAHRPVRAMSSSGDGTSHIRT